MRDILILLVHLIVTVAQLAGPGGLRSVVAESVLIRHQLLVLNRGRKRARVVKKSSDSGGELKQAAESVTTANGPAVGI